MRVLSLFSGIGGFDLGFQRAGMTVIGMCEIDPHAQKILQRQFPDATLHTDVRNVHYAKGTVDLICGGFPCQDLSVAGKRRGLAGNRSGLWFEFARVIDEAEPAWVVIENVPGLFSSAGGEDLAIIIQWLADRGYGVGWRVLDAQGFGLAQRRKRVFIVGSFGTPRGCTVLLEPEGLRRDSEPSGKEGKSRTRTAQAGVDVSFTIRGPAGSTNGDGRINNNLVPDISNTITSREGMRQTMDETFLPDTPPISQCLTAHGQRYNAHDETLIPTYSIQGSMVAAGENDGGPHGSGISEDISYTLMTSGPHSVAYVMREDAKAETFSINPTDVSPTLQALQPATTSHHAQMLIAASEQIHATYAIDAAHSNSWKSDNPHSGIHAEDVARTIDTSGTNPTANQGGNLIVPIMIQGNHVDRESASNGSGFNEDNISFTLTATDRHAVAWNTGIAAFQQNTREEVRMIQDDGQVTGALSASGGMHQTNFIAVQDVAPTLRAESKQSLMSGDGNINAALAIGFSGQKSSMSVGIESVPTLDTSTVSNVLWESTHTDDPARMCTNQDVAPTLQARMGTGGNSTPMIGVRRLTPVECERLQGFPDGWTDGQSDTQRYKQLGNAVAVPVAEWIGKRILESMKKV